MTSTTRVADGPSIRIQRLRSTALWQPFREPDLKDDPGGDDRRDDTQSAMREEEQQ